MILPHTRREVECANFGFACGFIVCLFICLLLFVIYLWSRVPT